MPEIKNTFLQGKMNKDLDERLVPNGQYRDALNIEVSTSEGSDVGTVKNILGNKRIDDVVKDGYTCVGSIADEKNNKVYWFISSFKTDAILEYDVEFDEVVPILVDAKASLTGAVLKFTGSIITGINIIDDLLFWTDNQGEPKKINIKECKKGTDKNALQNENDIKHTQLTFTNGSFHGMTLEQVWTTAEDLQWDPETGSKVSTGKYFSWQANQMEKIMKPYYSHMTVAIEDLTTYRYTQHVRHYRNHNFLGRKPINVILSDETSNSKHGFYSRITPNASSSVTDWQKGDVLLGDNIKIDIKEEHITVIKPKPLTAPSVKINYEEKSTASSSIPNLFETKFPRFSYRYKYRDGEFSPMAPFTHAVFNATYSKDINSNASNVSLNKDNIYTVKEGYNKAMVNSIHSVELTDFISNRTPEDVVEVDILYKQDGSPVVYSIGTIKHLDPEWHAWSNNEGYNIGVGVNKSNDWNHEGYLAWGGDLKGKYTVTTENIYAALPENQILRPWDNVPRKALAQEVTGNRIVYGNYLQNYNLGSKKTIVKVDYKDRSADIGSFASQGLPSIKSQRNYQLGVTFSDKYGRETPVFTSTGGAITIPWASEDGLKNASRSTQLHVGVASSFPEWVDSIKFFIKENSREYYNLTMDRAWLSQKTYELDNSEGHLWISFPSSDRNKLQEGDFITLKKKIGSGEQQIAFENKFKVLDIKNEAPDAIKYELVNYGWIRNGNNFFNDLFPGSHRRIDREVDTILMDIDEWKLRGDGTNLTHINAIGETLDQQPLHTEDSEDASIKLDNLYISWRLVDTDKTGVSSKKYKIKAGTKQGTNYFLKLSSKISKEDADLAHRDGVSDNGTSSSSAYRDNLVFQVERKEEKDSEEFSGKFFVKISENQITKIITSEKSNNSMDTYLISTSQPGWAWLDKIGTNITLDHNINTGNADYGVINSSATWDEPGTGNRDIRNSANNNNVGQERPDGTVPTTGGGARVTDWYKPWDGILAEHNDKGAWFIDGMFMAAGQSDNSNLAKHCCVTWAGCTKNDPTTPEQSSWAYPPLKTWWTDFKKSPKMVNTLNSFTDPDQNVSVIDAVYAGTWIDSNQISVAHQAGKNPDWGDLRIDGWVGPLQKVIRSHPPAGPGDLTANHVNGLEAIVTTTDKHIDGPRRWLSGINNNSTGGSAGVDTKTYGNKPGRHFIHISYFAPGVDLHDNTWGGTNDKIIGVQAIAGKLQGIWGGGHFTGKDAFEQFGTGTGKHQHLSMERNNDESTFKPLKEPPGPGVGQGYDIKYEEDHNRQWDPTYGSGNADPSGRKRKFISNLVPGSKFKFSNDRENATDATYSNIGDAKNPTIYTIKNVTVKKLYNHTSWRTAYNTYLGSTNGYYEADFSPISSTLDLAYKSVEQVGLEWLDTTDGHGANGNTTKRNIFRQKIVDFGKRSNRRVCYIIEIDKDPMASGNFNPISHALHSDIEMHAENDNFANIEFLEEVRSELLSDLSKFPAIWETDPKKQDVDLDIYYEASNHIPVRINEETNELFAPIGCKVEVLDARAFGVTHMSSQSVDIVNNVNRLTRWEGNTAIVHPGFSAVDAAGEIDYSGVSFKFTKEDGSFVIAQADENPLVNVTDGLKKDFIFKEKVGQNMRVGLSWYNCFSFGNGLESNRIKDDFNESFLLNGVKASTVTQQTYEEERRSHGLIYSGIYNSNSGVNDLNQFIMAEKITKDLNPTYGSIQKLFQRRISLIAFCEDRVISITSNKDAIYNADGNPQLISSNRVLGDANPFIGDYGISKNPESFAAESYRAYFADKQRGAILRLSKDGLTPISKSGMHDWFRDELPKYSTLIGSYDSYKEDYNITLSKGYAENLVFNSFFEEGVNTETVEGSLLNIIKNPIITGTPFSYGYDLYNVLTSDKFMFKGSDPSFLNPELIGRVEVINHAAIPAGSLQSEIPSAGAVDETAVLTSEVGWFPATFTHSGSTMAYHQFSQLGGVTANPFSGNWSDQAGTPASSGATYKFNRHHHPYAGLTSTSPFKRAALPFNQVLEANTHSYFYDPQSTTNLIIRNTLNGHITFDHVKEHGQSTGFEIYDFQTPSGNPTQNPLHSYNDDPNTSSTADGNRVMYNGEEIVVRARIRVPASYTAYTAPDYDDYGVGGHVGFRSSVPQRYYGFNHIMPIITLYDGDIKVNPNKLQPAIYGGTSGIDYGYYNQKIISNVWDVPVTSYLGSSISNQQVGGYSPSNNQMSFIQQADYFGGLDSEINATLTADKKWLGDVDYDNIYYCDSFHEGANPVQFPITVNPTTYTTIVNAGPGPEEFDQFYTTYHIQAHFKFKKPNQGRNGSDDFADMAPYWDNNTPGGGTFTWGVEEVPVVNDLRVRIGQNLADSQNPNLSAMVGDSKYQYWEVDTLSVKKILKVTHPHTDYAAQTTGNYVRKNAIKAVTKVPEFDVPQWTQINHLGLDGWDRIGYYAKGYNQQQLKHGGWGNNYNAVLQTGVAQNLTVAGTNHWGETLYNTNVDGHQIRYVVPQDWKHLPGSPSLPTDHGGTPFKHQYPDGTGNNTQATGTFTNKAWSHGVAKNINTSPHTSLPGFDRVALGKGGPNNIISELPSSATVLSHSNEYFTVWQSQDNSASDYIYDISSKPWQNNQWYLVDIEHHYWSGDGDHHNPNLGTGGANGIVVLKRTIDPATPSGGASADDYNDHVPGSFGILAGGSNDRSIGFKHVQRTEYGNPDGSGDNKWVLRVIFKYVSHSSNNPNECWIRFWDLQNQTAISKIIIKKISPNRHVGNIPDKWWVASNPMIHSFDKKQIYFKNNSICWNTEDDQPNWLGQSFNSTGTSPAPQESPRGWKCKFTLDDNPDTGNFTGDVRMYIVNKLGDFEAGKASLMKCTGIQDKGTYEIFFNMTGDGPMTVDIDGVATPWYIKRSTDDGSTWTDYTNNVDMFTSQATTSIYDERIVFTGAYSSGNYSASEFSVRNISLTNETSVLVGGDSKGWVFRGFDTAIDDYISWDGVPPNDGRLSFNGMPYVDPNSTSAQVIPITASQWIDRTIKKGEKYLIEFEYYLTNGHLKIYYYNSDGEGFLVEPMETYANNPNDPGTKTGTYSKVHEIGEETWTALNPDGNQYTTRLKNTFVILKGSGANPMSGWVDNIKMLRHFGDDELTEQTVTFSEDVNGWTSFKSFIPESGVSISKQYFTFDKGQLYKHSVPLMSDYNTITTPEQAVNYNTFYGKFYNSEITAVLNSGPSLVKTFNTLNYEGGQAQILAPQDEELVQTYNSLEYATGFDTPGWYCESISTDLDFGTIEEFIKKEGKWFNYIKGESNNINVVDTSLFSTQGIGVITQVETIVPSIIQNTNE